MGIEKRSHLLHLGGGGSGDVRCRGVIKEKSPDFRSPEVGISGKGTFKRRTRNQTLQGCVRNKGVSFLPLSF